MTAVVASLAVTGVACGGRISPAGVRPASQADATNTPTAQPKLTAGAATVAAQAENTATSFDDFPVLWLGPAYDSDGDGSDDMPLKHAGATQQNAFLDPRTGRELRPALRDFSLSYGTCEIPPHQDECTIPITIVFDPPDAQRPPLAGVEQHLSVRGVEAATFDSGSLWIPTADFTITIIPSFARDGAERLNQSLRIASLLFGANAKASWITRGTDFHPMPTPTPTPVAARTFPPHPTDTPQPATTEVPTPPATPDGAPVPTETATGIAQP